MVPRQLGRQRTVRAGVVHRGRRSSCWPATTPTGAPRAGVPGGHAEQVKDATSQLQQLQQGDVDIAMQINFDSVGQLEGVEGVTTELVDSYNFVYLALSPGAGGGEELAGPEGARGDQAGARLRRASSTRRSAATASCRRRRSRTGSRAAKACRCRSRTSTGPRRCWPRPGVDGLTLEAAYPRSTSTASTSTR